MNELIAKEIMDWNLIQKYDPLRGKHVGWDKLPFRYVDTPNFCGSISAVWMVVEKLESEGLLLWLECNQMWEAYFRKREESYSIGGKTGQISTALTAPLAICRAALQAKGIKTDEI